LKSAVLALETRHFPSKIASRFEQNELETEPFVRLFARYPDVAICRIKYTTRASLVSEMEAEMMNIEKENPVLIQYGIFYNRQDLPVMAGRVTYLADKIELGYEISDIGGQKFKVLV